jgi:coatomer subunit zeta
LNDKPFVGLEKIPSPIAPTAIDDGSRILTKYYSNPHPPAGNQTDYPGQIAYKTVKDQKAFEKGLLGWSPR